MMMRASPVLALLSLGAAQQAVPYRCRFDVVPSGRIGTDDLLHFLTQYGVPAGETGTPRTSSGYGSCDFDGSGTVGADDLLLLLAAFQTTVTGCTPTLTPVDCAGAMAAWDTCTLPCGGGTQARSFVVSVPASNGGVCPADGTSESQACNTQVCPPPPVDCVGDYGALGACSQTCGPNGVATRTFAISTTAANGGSACTLAAGNVETQPCNTAISCPVDCVGAMDAWGACSLPCGGGTQARSFVVSAPAQHGGLCPADGTSESQACNTDACPPPPPAPVDCVGDYESFGACTETCGPNGVQTRSFIIATSASNGGTACTLAAGDADTQPCNTDISCPVDCTGAMAAWDTCTLLCGGGTQGRSFVVSVPASNGGACPADGTSESQACNTQVCTQAGITFSTCAATEVIATEAECSAAAASLGVGYNGVTGPEWTSYCILHGGAVFYSPDVTDSTQDPSYAYVCDTAGAAISYIHCDTAATGIIATEVECSAAAAVLGITFTGAVGTEWASGCLFHEGTAHFSPQAVGSTEDPTDAYICNP